MSLKHRSLSKDKNGFAYMAFGFLILALFIVGSFALNAYQEPTEMDVIILDVNAELISENETTETYKISAEVKNVGAKGTALIGLKCVDGNQTIIYEDVEVLDLDKNQRINTSHLVEKTKGIEINAQFYVSKTIKDSQSIKPLSSDILLSRP